MEYHLILNPAAGWGAGQKSESYLLKSFEIHFPGFHYHKTNARGHATEIACKLKDRQAVLIAAGGDGTVHEVVNGMMLGNCVLGVIPIGSGNDFIKMLNIPKNIPSAIRVIRTNKTMLIDVGKANDSYFSNGLGMGFDAVVVMETSKTKFARGFFIYLFSVFRALRYYNNTSVTLHLNNTIETRDVLMVNVGNGAVLGGGFRLFPDADMADGKLDVCIFSRLTKREIVMNLPKAISGKHIHLPQVEMRKTDHLLIEAYEGIPIHSDGELISSNIKKIEIRVMSKALNVIHNMQN